eukprot:m.50122 g.50122  ORF g.50122 m.50122 type:complete len:268 (-) comp11554_c0_seq2:48-851(-)
MFVNTPQHKTLTIATDRSIPNLAEELADACAQILLDAPSDSLVTDEAAWLERVEESVSVIGGYAAEDAERMAVALEHARVREQLANILAASRGQQQEELAVGDACLAYLEMDNDWHEATVTALGPDSDTLTVRINQFGAVQTMARKDVVFLKDVADDDDEMVGEGVCELCERQLPITHHHLRPKSEHTRLAKLFPRSVLEVTVPICRGCHNAVHHSETNFTLAQNYYTLDLIREHPAIVRWVDYARGTKRQTSWDMAMMRNHAATRK